MIHFTCNTYYELCNNDRNRVIKNDRHKFVPWGFLRKNIRSQFVLAKRSVNSRLCYYIPQYNRFDLQQLIFIMVISIMTRRFRWILGGIIWDNTKISPLVSFRKSTYPKYMREIYILRNRTYKYNITNYNRPSSVL